MSDTERKLRDQMAGHYETYMREAASAEALVSCISGCECDEPCECTTGDDARAEAAVHATLAQAAASMANTLALLLARETKTA